MRTKSVTVYEVLQGRTVICSAKMGLTKREAENKVENEVNRFGEIDWSIRPVLVQMEQR